MNRTKKSLLMSILSLLLCLSMLVGTTWAWFTDSVTSSGNKIVAGNLSVDLLHLVDDEWVSLKKDPDHKIFNYDRWEPGYTRLEKIKVANLGDLALKYQLSATTALGSEISGPNGERLSDVIDVYLCNGDSTVSSFAEIKADSSWIKAGTLSEMQTAIGGFARGGILPADSTDTGTDPVGEQTISVALHMQESAGNEYQLLSVGDFYLTLVATQYTYEEDTFGSDYDLNATFPTGVINYSVSAPVTLNADNTAASDVTLADPDGVVNAVVSAGTKLLPGTTELTLSVTELDESTSNVKGDAGSELRSVDVHVEGVDPSNSEPIIVTVKALMPLGMNMGNFTLYHVENGAPVAMTCVSGEAELDAHNEYTYDPSTGNVRMALASFSVVAASINPANKWNGTMNTTWYNTTSKAFYLASADQLMGFGAIVGGMAPGIEADDFAGKTVYLLCDIDLGDAEANNTSNLFYPIGYYNSTKSYEKVSGGSVTSNVSSFSGTFDGCGHTIANFYQNTWEMFGDYNSGYSGTPNHYKDAMGLFGYALNATIKNLTVDHFSSDGEFTPTGIIAAYAENSTFENIAVTNCNPRVYNTGNGGIVGIGGREGDTSDKKLTFTNITVDQTNKISALWGSWDVGCGGIMGMFRGNSKIFFTNCHAAAQIDAYNDVCGNYQYYWYRYAGMIIGTIDLHTTDSNGYTIPDTSMITAVDCTAYFGEWNNYYYCELVDNSLASYTHDHQFSRLTKVDSVDVANKTYTIGDVTTAIPAEGRYNFVVIKDKNAAESTENAVCYHFVNGAQHKHEDKGTETVNGDTVLKEDKQHVYLPFNQIFQGYGWGVKNIPLTDFKDRGITKLDGDGYSKQKWTTSFGENGENTVTDVSLGYEIRLDTLFAALPNANPPIKNSNVTVSIMRTDVANPAEHDAVLYNAGAGSWTDMTIRFKTGGTYTITIQDYYFCEPTSITVNASIPTFTSTNRVFLAHDEIFGGENTQYDNPAKNDKTVNTLAAAYAALDLSKDGEIIVIGTFSTNSLFRAPTHTGTVTIRGLDDASVFEICERTTTVGYRYYCGGPTKFDDIRIEADKKGISGTTNEENNDTTSNLSWNLVGNFNDLTITESVIMNRKGNDFILVLGAQGGGSEGGAADIKVKDATLTLNGGSWSEAVGVVRSGFNDQAGNEYLQFVNKTYHITLNIGGNVNVDKVFTFARSIVESSQTVNNVTIPNVGLNASCTVNLTGGQIDRFMCNHHFLTLKNWNFHKGTSVYVDGTFDISKSFEVEAVQTQSNLNKGRVVYGAMSGESGFYYDAETDAKYGSIDGAIVPMLGKTNLYVETPELLAALKEAVDSTGDKKIALETFAFVGIGERIDEAPVKGTVDNVYYLGYDGKQTSYDSATNSATNYLHTVGWVSPSAGDMCVVLATGGTYYAVGRIGITDSTTIGKTGSYTAAAPIYFTSYNNTIDVTTQQAEKGVFFASNGKIVTINGDVIFDNIGIMTHHAGDWTMKVASGGRVVIGSKTQFLTRKSAASGCEVHAVVEAGGILYLNNLNDGFDSYTGTGTIVLSNELIVALNKDATYNTAHDRLHSFIAQGGTVCDENGNQLKSRYYKAGSNDNTYLLYDNDGNIPYAVEDGKLLYRPVVFVKDGGTGNGSSPEYAIDKITGAYYILGKSGGTIVFCGDFTMSGTFNEDSVYKVTDGSTDTVNDPHFGTITLTQKYGDVDYSETHFVTFTAATAYYINGPFVLENINFKTTAPSGTNRGVRFVAQYHDITLGEGIRIQGFTGDTIGENFAVIGGFNAASTTETDRTKWNDLLYGQEADGANITINSCTAVSGNGLIVVALDRYLPGVCPYDATITVNGGTIYRFLGSSVNKGSSSGKVDITINDCTIQKAIDFTQQGGSAVVNLTINGGNYDGMTVKTISAAAKTAFNVVVASSISTKLPASVFTNCDSYTVK